MLTKGSILLVRQVGGPSPHTGPDIHRASRAALLENALNPKLIGKPKG